MPWPFNFGGWGGGGGVGWNPLPTGQNPLGNNPTATPSPAPTGYTPPPTAPPAAPAPAPVPTAPAAQAQPAPTTTPQIPPNLMPQPGGINNGANGANTYLQFAQWWNSNYGTQPPSYQDWINGNLNAPQSASGGGTPPAAGGTPNNPQTPDVGTPAGPVDFNSPEAFNALALPQLLAAFPGLQTAGHQFDPSYRGNFADEAAGPWYGGQFGLPGREADSQASLLFNILMNEAAAQSGRQGEGESLLRDVMNQLGASEALGTSRQASALAGERLSPGSLDSLRGSLQSDLSTSLAAERNASMNALRETGALGQGAASTAALGGLTNRLGGLRQRGQFDIQRIMEDLTNQRIGQGAQTATAGADVERALGRDPVYALVQALSGPRNAAIGPVQGFLEDVISLNAGQAASERGGTFFESIAPLIGSAIGAAGDIGSAYIGRER